MLMHPFARLWVSSYSKATSQVQKNDLPRYGRRRQPVFGDQWIPTVNETVTPRPERAGIVLILRPTNLG